ncbi:MAG: glycosyltransferase family 2 protein, partial [Geobacter sp.]
MTTPTIDIIIPVWNQPFETRACLVSILNTADSARLIIINNGCDRDTELLLEEFCEPLGNRV